MRRHWLSPLRRQTGPRKSSRSRNRVLRNEPLEPRAMLSGGGLYCLLVSAGPSGVRSLVAVNSAPTLVQPASTAGSATVAGKTASLSVLGRDDGGEAKLTYTWSVVAAPTGGAASFSLNGCNAAKHATATFSAAGRYSFSVRITDAGGLSATSTTSVVVSASLTSLRVSTPAGQILGPGSSLAIAGTSQAFAVQGLDQFGKAIATPAANWSASTLPLGAARPQFTATGTMATARFSTAGYYVLNVRVSGAPAISCSFVTVVNQVLSSIVVSPAQASIFQGATQQFAAQGFDQFAHAMTVPSSLAWNAGAGTISASGLLVAPATGSSCTVTARSGAVSGTATVTLLAKPAPAPTPTPAPPSYASLADMARSLDADGSISRLDMIQILRAAGTDGTVSAAELGDLRQILSQAGTLNIPGYVQVLAGDVVNGNVANTAYAGQALGNLAAGSSSTQLNKLIDKWFYGADHPALCNTSLTYQATTGSLFPHTPSHLDERQGALGDCYFISAMGTLADSNPAAVRNMFINNGDGTYTVRFYTGRYGTIYNWADGSIGAGFSDNTGTADYVTVDGMLPASRSGALAYADYGANVADVTNALWIPLAEKAYAQWNETGKEGRDGLNAYSSIQGGWMATVDAQVLGYNAVDYIMTRTAEQVAVNALAAGKAVTIGTLSWTGTNYGLYATHAYAIVGYNASSDTFTLYNPWGTDQPGPLSWQQLQSACSQMAVADTSGTTAISLALAQVSTKTSSARLASDPAAAMSSHAPRGAAPVARSAPDWLVTPDGHQGRLPGCYFATSHGAVAPSEVDALLARDGALL